MKTTDINDNESEKGKREENISKIWLTSTHWFTINVYKIQDKLSNRTKWGLFLQISLCSADDPLLLNYV